MQAFMAKAALFWASKRASNMLITALALLASAGVWYVQGLRVQVAECKASQEQRSKYDALADRYIDRLNDERSLDEEAIRNATAVCLDRTVDSLLIPDEADTSQVQPDPTQQ